MGRQLRAHELRRRRGHGRARRTTSATSSSRRNTACRSNAVIDVAARDTAPEPGGPVRRTRHLHQFGQIRRAGLQARGRCDRAPICEARAWATSRCTWRLRDWGISRQRYWGCPIPIIHCGICGAVPVPDERAAGGAAGGPGARRQRQSARQARAHFSTAPARAAASRRGARPTPWTPSSTRPGISCALPASGNGAAMVDARVDYWLPVDQYIGGIEHAILHLLYSRFWTEVMRDLGADRSSKSRSRTCSPRAWCSTRCSSASRRRAHQYFNPPRSRGTGRRGRAAPRGRAAADGEAVESGGVGHHVQVEEQRRRSAVPGGELRRRHRALFHDVRGPPEQTLEWSDEGVQGAYRFIKRLWNAVHEHVAAGAAAALARRGSMRRSAR